MLNGEQFIFQQDGATAHTSNVTQGWLHKNVPQFIEKEQWPPYCPDLNPMDYSIWSILENRVCTNSHKSVVALKRKLREEWEKIPQEVPHATVEALPGRLTKVIQNKCLCMKILVILISSISFSNIASVLLELQTFTYGTGLKRTLYIYEASIPSNWPEIQELSNPIVSSTCIYVLQFLVILELLCHHDQGW